MKTQFDDWTIDDFSVEDVKQRRFIPNWLLAGYKSKSEALDGIMKIVKDREGMFARLGLIPGPLVKKDKKKKDG